MQLCAKGFIQFIKKNVWLFSFHNVLKTEYLLNHSPSIKYITETETQQHAVSNSKTYSWQRRKTMSSAVALCDRRHMLHSEPNNTTAGRHKALKPSTCVKSHCFAVTSQLQSKLLASLVSLFRHQAPLSSGNSAPWLWTCVFLQAARINNMLTSRRRSAQRPQAPKHLLLFGTHFPITTMNPTAQAPPPSCYPLICSQRGFLSLFIHLFFYFFKIFWNFFSFCRPEPHALPQLEVLNILARQKHMKHTTHIKETSKQQFTS